MTIWDSICHSQWFKQTSIVGRIAWFPRGPHADVVHAKILFLNKNDLFERKIPTSDIKNFFPVSTRTSCWRTSTSRLINLFRTSKVSQGTFVPVAITSSDGSQNWLKKPVVRKSARYIYSKLLSLLLFYRYIDMTWSITTATDTAMLRVVMAAVEGTCIHHYVELYISYFHCRVSVLSVCDPIHFRSWTIIVSSSNITVRLILPLRPTALSSAQALRRRRWSSSDFTFAPPTIILLLSADIHTLLHYHRRPFSFILSLSIHPLWMFYCLVSWFFSFLYNVTQRVKTNTHAFLSAFCHKFNSFLHRVLPRIKTLLRSISVGSVITSAARSAIVSKNVRITPCPH